MSEIRCRLPTTGTTSVDVLVIGGGIIGAGIFRRCARLGYRVLMVDRNDFASGTSSRSSNLVHGGLHYFVRLQLGLARQSCRDRNALLFNAQGLVNRTKVLLPKQAMNWKVRWVISALLAAYEGLAGAPKGGSFSDPGVQDVEGDGLPLPDGVEYVDGITDDAGLVLRVIREGCSGGGHARNHARVRSLIKDADGAVTGARLTDGRTGQRWSVRARCVVNATGAWGDRLRGELGRMPRLTFLKGSHLVVPWRRIPVRRVIAGLHPGTGRPITLIPWKGVTLIGSTSVPHPGSLESDPVIQPEEAEYLLRGAQHLLPGLGLSPGDVCATYSGLRAIVGGTEECSAHASRESMIEEEDGLITVAGGKLTTFPSMAREVTEMIGKRMPEGVRRGRIQPLASESLEGPRPNTLARGEAVRIHSRYGQAGVEWVAASSPGERQVLPGLPVSTAELRWALKAESVLHLDDLLLRRTRIGRTHPEALGRVLPRVAAVIREEAGWTLERWSEEADRFRRQVRQQNSMPTLPDFAPVRARPAVA